MTKEEIINNKWGFTIYQIDKYYRIIVNYKNDLNCHPSTAIIAFIHSFPFDRDGLYEFLNEVYYNWTSFLETIRNENKVIWNIGLIMIILLLFILIIIIGTVIHIGAAAIGIG